MLDWVVGNAQQLPFPDNSMDAYTIAFGIRNCTDIPAVLREVFPPFPTITPYSNMLSPFHLININQGISCFTEGRAFYVLRV